MTANNARRLTQAELLAELTERFGDDPMRWAFRCPHCSDVATAQDFVDAIRTTGKQGHASDVIGRECIGRILGALKKDSQYTGRGCDWTAYGLFRGPWLVELPDGKEVGCFPIADTNETGANA